jgi:hypothetical protein
MRVWFDAPQMSVRTPSSIDLNGADVVSFCAIH